MNLIFTPQYTIEIEPRQADRARGNPKTGSFYNTKEYTNYKNLLSLLLKNKSVTIDGKLIKGVEIPPDNYNFIQVYFYYPYPKSYPINNRKEGALKETLPDWDNVIKAFQDSLAQARVIKNDNTVVGGIALKRYTLKDTGRIEFSLHNLKEI